MCTFFPSNCTFMQKAAKVMPQFLFIFVYKEITVFWITFAFPMIVLSVLGKAKVKEFYEGQQKKKKEDYFLLGYTILNLENQTFLF